MVTASKWWLARLCQYPWHSGLVWPSSTTSWAAKLGTITHKLLQNYAEQGTFDCVGVARLLGGTAKQNAYAKVMAESGRSLLDLQLREKDVSIIPEGAFAVDGSTGSVAVLRPEYHRDYRAVPPGWFAGTQDMVTLQAGRLVHVRDWKTGRNLEPYRSQGVAQVEFLGYAAAQHYGTAGDIEVEVTYLDKGGAPPARIRKVLGSFELQVVKAELRLVHEGIQGRKGPVPGEHCGRCPVNQQCPEYANGKQ